MRHKKILLLTVLIAFVVNIMTVPAYALQVNDVAGEFICNCGCKKLLSACEMKCGDTLRGYIKDKIRQGLGKEQIMQFMKVNFQGAILAAPEKKGFFLTAWITPFLLVVLGGILVSQVVGAWGARRREQDEASAAETNVKERVKDKYDVKVEEELKDFGW